MAAENPNGGQQFWVDGFPFDGVGRTNAPTGGLNYWVDGFPSDFIFPEQQTTFGHFNNPVMFGF